MNIHCGICGDEEKQESLRRSVRMIESIAVCKKCRGLE